MAPYPCLSMNTTVRTSNFAKCDLAFVIFSVTCCFCSLVVVWYVWSLLFFKSYGTHYQFKKMNVCNKSQYSTINCYLAPTQQIKSERILSWRNANSVQRQFCCFICNCRMTFKLEAPKHVNTADSIQTSLKN